MSVESWPSLAMFSRATLIPSCLSRSASFIASIRSLWAWVIFVHGDDRIVVEIANLLGVLFYGSSRWQLSVPQGTLEYVGLLPLPSSGGSNAD